MFLCLLTTSAAAQNVNPGVNDILQHIENNRALYRNSVPNFSGNEHLLAELRSFNTDRWKADFTVSLHRRNPADSAAPLEETREPQSTAGNQAVDPRAALQSPAFLSGVFSDGPGFAFLSDRACFQFKLQGSKGPAGTTLLEFETVPVAQRSPSCKTVEIAHGRIFIDPQTYQVVRIEKVLPRHEIFREVLGNWTWSIDYAPVSLAGQTFWLPKTIKSAVKDEKVISTMDGRVTEGTVGTRHTWILNATYTDFHAVGPVLP